MVTLRILTPEDWRLWRELRLQALEEAPRAFGSTLEEWQEASEQSWRTRWQSVAFNVVASLEGRPAGIAGATQPDSTRQVELRSMWVAPWARGHGVGDALVRAVLKWGEESLARSFILQVFEDNGRAIALYRRHGFASTPSTESAGEDSRRKQVMVRSV